VRFRFLRLAPDEGEPSPTESRILDCRRMRATAEMARSLDVRPGDGMVAIRRVLSFSGTPTIVDDIYLPVALFKGLTGELLEHYSGPLYGLFETEFGVSMVRAEEKLRAVAADDEYAGLLQVAVGTPLLRVDRISYTYADRPVEFRTGHYVTDRYHYRNSLN
jgi:GntR family transcriptional regulator